MLELSPAADHRPGSDDYMDGTKALGYVRSRKADSDYQRMERQRILLQTIAKEVGITDLITKFTDLADIVKDDVRTSMTVDEARTLLAYLQSDNGEFQSIGLVPPIVKPGDPDYPSLQDYLQQLRDNVSKGEAASGGHRPGDLDLRLSRSQQARSPGNDVATASW